MSILPDPTTLAALFDMDGVIVNNMPYHETAWRIFCEAHGFAFSKEMYYTQLNGKNSFDSFAFLLGREPSAEELREMSIEKEEMYRNNYGPHLEPAEGLIGFLNVLREHGVKCAVATSAPIENVAFTLDGTGLRPLFDVVVDASMVQNGKPAPDIYLKAAESVGVHPKNCVVFEDALLGIQAGKAAGMPVIGVSTSHSEDELAPITSAVIADFREIDWNHFEAVVNR
ncbi:HAD family phosphatase [Siphonobacter sp. SORGH_AS_0500]|uniref:HAD family hydrolase n=1 Tax=Siphonobacter sp. SORGH_AS_0500 TaxID=1864824 RepID=UPI00285A4EA6|nr:HAD family phosphatase [Siphonobacter sp. SORGH_AS_0500]MDR6194358.1 beta-phosphoglucomutase [Siphonobacter sp. SORGH_AS_0500]